VQPLKPLRVVDIALSAGNSTRLAGIGKNDFKSAGLQYLVCGHPVDAGRFHRDRPRTSRDQPVGHALQIAGKRLEGLNWLIAQVRTDGNNMEPRTDVDTGRERMNDRQPGGLGSCSIFLHGPPPG
jgi:hypothetical protein